MDYLTEAERIIESNDLPPKLLVRYMLNCAEYVNMFRTKNNAIREIALNLVKLWLDNKQIDMDKLEEIAYQTIIGEAYTFNIAYAVVCPQNANRAAISALYNISYIVSFEGQQNRNHCIAKCYDLLLQIINEMSELEKLLLDIRI